MLSAIALVLTLSLVSQAGFLRQAWRCSERVTSSAGRRAPRFSPGRSRW